MKQFYPLQKYGACVQPCESVECLEVEPSFLKSILDPHKEIRLACDEDDVEMLEEAIESSKLFRVSILDTFYKSSD